MAGSDLLSKLRERIDGGVHVTTQTLLRVSEGIRDGGKGNVAHYEHIDVAALAQFAACRGPEHECHVDAVGQRLQTLSDDVGDPGRLQQESLELREYRTLAVHLKEDLASGHGPTQDIRFDEHP